VPKIASPAFFKRVEILFNDDIQVFSDSFSNCMQLLVVVFPLLLKLIKFSKFFDTDAGEVAHGYFVFAALFNDLSAEITVPDSA